MVTATERRRFVERMGGALTEAGLPRLPSRVFSALLVDEDGRMTAAELAAVLEVSAGGISGAVKYLSQVRMVRREHERGSRRDLYVVDDDAWHAAMLRTDQAYPPMIAAVDSVLADVATDDPARRRLVLTREFLAFVDGELADLARRWEARRTELTRERRG
jgi:DNA-binding transcriptional regulator GbsR (MarR family)